MTGLLTSSSTPLLLLITSESHLKLVFFIFQLPSSNSFLVLVFTVTQKFYFGFLMWYFRPFFFLFFVSILFEFRIWSQHPVFQFCELPICRISERHVVVMTTIFAYIFLIELQGKYLEQLKLQVASREIELQGKYLGSDSQICLKGPSSSRSGSTAENIFLHWCQVSFMKKSQVSYQRMDIKLVNNYTVLIPCKLFMDFFRANALLLQFYGIQISMHVQIYKVDYVLIPNCMCKM